MYDNSILDRFWSFVSKQNNCWIWTGGKDQDGYGIFKARGRSIRAHRFSYQHAFNYQLTSKVWVLHTCDNPSCVNPTHLILGDNKKNVLDRDAKGRQAKGERNAAAKITAKDVLLIRQIANSISVAEIADIYGLDRTHVYKILKGKYWKKT